MKTEIIYCESNHQVPPLMQGEKILKKGSINGEGNYPLPCDIRLLKDVEMHVSDGTKLYADIFLPVTDEKYRPSFSGVRTIKRSTTFLFRGSFLRTDYPAFKDLKA